MDTNEQIATKLFGWKWIAYIGRPMNSHPEYRTREKMRVRRFVSPQLLANKNWIKHFESIGGYADAIGDEPLDYCYCSSMGPEIVPCYSSSEAACEEMQTEIVRRGLWEKYQDSLPLYPWCEDRCRAALECLD